MLALRRRVQARAKAGSDGHGNRRARQSSAPETPSIANARPNTPALCSDSQINCGTAVTSPAKAAPAPNATIAAGSTQHTSVPLLASNASNATPRLRFSGTCARASLMGLGPLANGIERLGGPADLHDGVAGIGDGLAQCAVVDVAAVIELHGDDTVFQADENGAGCGECLQRLLDALRAERAHQAVDVHLDGLGRGQRGDTHQQGADHELEAFWIEQVH